MVRPGACALTKIHPEEAASTRTLLFAKSSTQRKRNSYKRPTATITVPKTVSAGAAQEFLDGRALLTPQQRGRLQDFLTHAGPDELERIQESVTDQTLDRNPPTRLLLPEPCACSVCGRAGA